MNHDSKNIQKYWLITFFSVIALMLGVFALLHFISEQKLEPLSFTLTDQNGDNYISTDDKNYKLVFFGFTHCPHICPTGLATMNTAVLSLSKPDNIQPIFITVDPERDTPSVINDYLQNFPSKIVGLSGDEAALNEVKENFSVYAQKLYPENEEEYTMDHSTHIYLLDKNDVMIDTFDYRADPQKLAKTIDNYMNQF